MVVGTKPLELTPMLAAPTLRTKRLVLRGHQASDHMPLWAMRQDPETIQHMGISAPSAQTQWMRLLQYKGLWPLLGYGFWVLELVSDDGDNIVIGEAGLAQFGRCMCEELDTGIDAGWVLDRKYWGQGLMGEALEAIFNWVDTQLPNEIWAIIEPENGASIALSRKNNFAHVRDMNDEHGTIGLYRRPKNA